MAVAVRGRFDLITHYPANLIKEWFKRILSRIAHRALLALRNLSAIRLVCFQSAEGNAGHYSRHMLVTL
jgi:hypothetical protein